KLNGLGLKPNTHNINEMAAYYKFPSPLDLYYGVAVGNIDLAVLKTFTINGDKFYQPAKQVTKTEKPHGHPGYDPNDDFKATKGSELIIFGESSDKILYKLAPCCQPIPGDDVFGFISSGEGLKIHRTDCPNAAQLLAHYGHRVVKTKWAKNKEISFLTGVRLTGLDDVGVIQKITNIISGDLKMNMRSISIDSKDGIFM